MSEVKKIKVVSIGKYNGHNIKQNRNIELSFKFGYDQLENSIMLLQMLNNNISIICRIGKEKPLQIGSFMLKQVNIDSDGESTVKFHSQLDFVEPNNLNGLAGELLNVMFKADVEVESSDEDDE